MDAKARFPATRQSDIPFDVWTQLSKAQHCSNFGLECSKLCQPIDGDGYYDVHVDHIIPRKENGQSTLENLRVICKCRNLSKGSQPDPNYQLLRYFDNNINPEKLRQHQLERAYYIPLYSHKNIFLNNYSLVLGNRLLLFAWLMGAGKTIGVCAFMFAINHLRAPRKARRIRRVLWMVHHVALVELISRELKGDKLRGVQSELVKYGIVDTSPDVWVPRDTAGLFSRPDADIVCVPVQRIWPAEGRTLSDDDRQRFLAGFDAIIIDEGHFGIDRYMEVIKSAPQALKICITATPIDGDSGKLLCDVEKGRYKPNFILVSTYGYDEGWRAGIYKQLHDFATGKKLETYMSVAGGDSEIQEGETARASHNDPLKLNVVRTNALAAIAARKAEQLDHLNGGPNLIMMRFDATDKARMYANAINVDPSLANHGAIAVYAGVRGIQHLSHERNPWMMVVNDGRLHGARFIICVDLGQIGVNNRFCSIIVWRDVPFSLIEIIQRLGRALRSMGTANKDNEKVILIWRNQGPTPPPDPRYDFEKVLASAIDYVLHLPDRLTGFLTISDLVQPAEITLGEPDTTLPIETRIELLTAAGGSPEATADELIQSILHRPGRSDEDQPSADQALAVVDFISNVARPSPDDPQAINTSRQARAAMLGIKLPTEPELALYPNDPARLPVISYVRAEAPPDRYTIEQMVSALRDFPDLSTHLPHWEAQIYDGADPVTAMIAARIRDRDLSAYQVHKLIWRVHEVIRGTRPNSENAPAGFQPPRAIANNFKEKYLRNTRLTNDNDVKAIAAKCTYIAAQKLLRLPTLSEDNPHVASYHVQIVDALLEPGNQTLIMRVGLLVLLLLHRDLVPELAYEFDDLLAEFGNILRDDLRNAHYATAAN